jgi:hypothetical protein
MRAIRARYNPYLQTKHRLEQVFYKFIIIKLNLIIFYLVKATWT